HRHLIEHILQSAVRANDLTEIVLIPYLILQVKLLLGLSVAILGRLTVVQCIFNSNRDLMRYLFKKHHVDFRKAVHRALADVPYGQDTTPAHERKIATGDQPLSFDALVESMALSVTKNFRIVPYHLDVVDPQALACSENSP